LVLGFAVEVGLNEDLDEIGNSLLLVERVDPEEVVAAEGRLRDVEVLTEATLEVA